MRADVERWDRRYRDRVLQPLPAPDPLLAEVLPGDGQGARALDVACGLGQNALWLASHGYRVDAVDGSAVALGRAAAEAARRDLAVRWMCADLDHFRPHRCSVDLVVVMRFLNRAAVPHLVRSLRPGGLFLYATFNIHRRRADDRFPLRYLVRPGELRALLEGLRVRAGRDDAPQGDAWSWVLAERA